jgi:hypothetical protein
VDHGEKVIGIIRVEGPEVEDLFTKCVDDFDVLALLYSKGYSPASGYKRHGGWV